LVPWLGGACFGVVVPVEDDEITDRAPRAGAPAVSSSEAAPPVPEEPPGPEGRAGVPDDDSTAAAP
jgi:hypothetical protein